MFLLAAVEFHHLHIWGRTWTDWKRYKSSSWLLEHDQVMRCCEIGSQETAWQSFISVLFMAMLTWPWHCQHLLLIHLYALNKTQWYVESKCVFYMKPLYLSKPCMVHDLVTFDLNLDIKYLVFQLKGRIFEERWMFWTSLQIHLPFATLIPNPFVFSISFRWVRLSDSCIENTRAVSITIGTSRCIPTLQKLCLLSKRLDCWFFALRKT
jgi:hypothetical protein